ncbi:hypothetical protein LshimejAT787_0901010 [Lyophyllum shimeji]|uniref:Uncharacterized protein n=1 Tax=Lyophyllum shimeji TaxID=47721 RepID=A0A9P3US68_LYOSH|nr:hypothetical protein LshimejAT787_0901010 [Lyophyllum shimeji]
MIMNRDLRAQARVRADCGACRAFHRRRDSERTRFWTYIVNPEVQGNGAPLAFLAAPEVEDRESDLKESAIMRATSASTTLNEGQIPCLSPATVTFQAQYALDRPRAHLSIYVLIWFEELVKGSRRHRICRRLTYGPSLVLLEVHSSRHPLWADIDVYHVTLPTV